MAAPITYAALLRGVNVGGKNKVPMADLRALCEELGHQDVASYVQSGNVVLRSPGNEEAVRTGLEAAIEKRFGLKISVLVRTHAELVAIDKHSPIREDDPKRLHVVFLSAAPTDAAIATLDPDRSPGDAFRVAGRELYLHVPNGAGNTKLTLDYFERKLGVKGTARNWNTLRKLIELTA